MYYIIDCIIDCNTDHEYCQALITNQTIISKSSARVGLFFHVHGMDTFRKRVHETIIYRHNIVSCRHGQAVSPYSDSQAPVMIFSHSFLIERELESSIFSCSAKFIFFKFLYQWTFRTPGPTRVYKHGVIVQKKSGDFMVIISTISLYDRRPHGCQEGH